MSHISAYHYSNITFENGTEIDGVDEEKMINDEKACPTLKYKIPPIELFVTNFRLRFWDT